MVINDSQKIAFFDSLGTNWLKHVPQKTVARVLGLYSIHELAKYLHCKPHQIRHQRYRGNFPSPSVRLRKRNWWSQDQLPVALKCWEVRRKYTPRGKYTPEQIQGMRQLHREGWSQWSIANEYGCTQSLVSSTETPGDRPMADDIWHFAYGSNLWIDRKERRTSAIRTGTDRPRIARLGNYRLAFNKRGNHGQVYIEKLRMLALGSSS